MSRALNRRSFLGASAGLAAVAMSSRSVFAATAAAKFEISLAEWSLHKTIFDKKLDNLDFAATAKKEFGIEAIEYVNQFFKDKAKDEKYLADSTSEPLTTA